jgi:ketosteroid isomerase-like protein
MKLADDDRAAVTEVLSDYYRAFSTLDAQAVLPYVHEPSQLVSSAGVVPTPTRAAVAAAFQPVMNGLRSRDFAKSELINLHLKRLSVNTVIAGGVAVRRKTDGQELERAGVVYLLQRTVPHGNSRRW